ncbi:MAG: 6-carboxytetrahydropterin synthase QueD [Thermoleophilia bacterium]|nr:6-carboxytetrahydropterin synthase QueD [Thermoleophilia bacterium]
MKTTITVSTSFAAAHRLPEHEGKCRRLHGHTYMFEVTVEGHPQPSGPSAGMVMDFADLRRVVDEVVVQPLDHSVLNEVLDFVPTVEAVAAWAFARLQEAGLPVVRVRLAEGLHSYVEVTP